MQFYDLRQGRFIEGAAEKPAFVAVTPKIRLAEVFDPDQAFRGIVKINLRRANFVFGEKLRDLDVVAVLLAFAIVFNQDDRLVRRAAHPVELPIRSALLARGDFDLRLFEPGEMNPGLPKKQLGAGGSRCRCH